MSYAAEPYAQFVDDLLTALTGGEVRERFVFLPEQAPFRLSAPGPVVPRTLRVFGQARGAYSRFRADLDYVLDEGSVIRWLARADGTPAADAVWPDEGTPFFANYEHLAPDAAVPRLTDRNPGSVTRLLAESFAREFAVISRQLEAVYEAGFVETAGGRDLDQLVRLVGVSRRTRTFASGAVVFARSTPAEADVFIPAGTRLSTSVPPSVAFETTEVRVLRRGELSAEAPIAAREPGPAGVVPAGVVTVIHRPILGIESVANPQPTRFGGADETDEALRARARRALEGAGRATTRSLLAALTTVPGVSEKDIRLAEDHLAHPGVVRLTVAVPDLTAEQRRRAAELIEETRPVGVRVVHNLEVPASAGEAAPGPGGAPDEGEVPVSEGVAPAGEAQFMPVAVRVQLVPTALGPGAEERRQMERAAREIVDAFFGRAGVGGVLVYHRLVADLMSVEGVMDVGLELFPEADPSQPHHRNVFPRDPALRPVPGTVEVEVGGRLVLLYVTVGLTLKGAGLIGDPASNRLAAREEIETQLRERIQEVGAELTRATMRGLLSGSESYVVTSLHYEANYVEAGVRIRRQDVPLRVSGLERLWIGGVALAQESGT